MEETQDGIPKLGTTTFFGGSTMGYGMGAILAQGQKVRGLFITGVWGANGYWLMAMTIGYVVINYMAIGYWLVIVGYMNINYVIIGYG